jgi:hypothetical protein
MHVPTRLMNDAQKRNEPLAPCPRFLSDRRIDPADMAIVAAVYNVDFATRRIAK